MAMTTERYIVCNAASYRIVVAYATPISLVQSGMMHGGVVVCYTYMQKVGTIDLYKAIRSVTRMIIVA